MLLEVEENPNCESTGFKRFKELGPVRRVRQICMYDRKDEGEWCHITGWTSTSADSICPAYAVPVEDSGAGMAYLIYGGNWGLRFKPLEIEEKWDLNSPHQWGEPYLIAASPRDLKFEEEPDQGE